MKLLPLSSPGSLLLSQQLLAVIMTKGTPLPKVTLPRQRVKQ